jgi:branched-chain amino acid transport system substrate-binding protein
MEITNKELHEKMAFWRKNLSFDAVILTTLIQYGPQIIRTARDEGVTEPMILSESLDSSELITRVGGGDKDLSNIYVATLYHPDSPYKSAGEFYRKYRAAYGESPTGLSAQGYDTVHLLAYAIARANSLVPDRIADKLREVKNLEGATGPQTILPDGDMIKPLMFQIIRDGKFVYHATEGGGEPERSVSGTERKHVKP